MPRGVEHNAVKLDSYFKEQEVPFAVMPRGVEHFAGGGELFAILAGLVLLARRRSSR